MKILETKRLMFRRFQMEDLDDLHELYCDPEVTKHIPDAPTTFEEARRELERHRFGHPENQQLGLWATIDKGTGRFIGRCGLLPWKLDGVSEIEVAYTLSRAYWGKGLGTEAARGILCYGFEQLDLSRLVCLVDEGNEASIKVATKIGMRFERTGVDEIGPYLLYSTDR